MSYKNFKKLSLDEEQRKLKILASINLNNETRENEEKDKSKGQGQDVKVSKEEGNYVEELNEALGVLKNIDLTRVENRILAENLISSIL